MRKKQCFKTAMICFAVFVLCLITWGFDLENEIFDPLPLLIGITMGTVVAGVVFVLIGVMADEDDED